MKLVIWYVERFEELLSWLFPLEPGSVRLDRLQWQEREERVTLLAMELSTPETTACRARVRLRMTEGDRIWLPPLFGREAAYRDWRSRHQGRFDGVIRIEGR